VTDPAALERALDGCGAVLHAASVFPMDARRANEMRAVKVRVTEIVLGRRGGSASTRSCMSRANSLCSSGQKGDPHPRLAREATSRALQPSKADFGRADWRFQELDARVVSVTLAAAGGARTIRSSAKG